jgi:hypothetical protein
LKADEFMNTPSLSTPVTRWLESICFERFGLHLKLTAEEGQTRIDLGQGAAPSILVTAIPDMYCGNQLAGQCLTWDPVAEGFISALNRPIPAPGAVQVKMPLIEEREDGYTIHYDILGLTYWMLSRAEEVGRTDLDEQRRFPATASHAFNHNYLERPIVDEWLHILGQLIERTWPGIVLKHHNFSQKVSHDVDSPSRYAFRSWAGFVRAMAGDVLKRGDVKSALAAPWVRLHSHQALHPADPSNTFDWIMDVSERHGLQSAFYFICGRTDESKDADYEPEHPAIRELMRRIHRRGHEIGLHPSYGTFQKPAAIAAEAARLKHICAEEGILQEAWGGRMHYLRWQTPTTLHGWEQADMAYDSTLSYADRPGFRCGTCFEYPAFDPVAGNQLNLRIRPLIAMECTVMAPRYMGLGDGQAALDKFLQLKDACKAVGGCFTLLWHNSQFETAAERNLYEGVLSINTPFK